MIDPITRVVTPRTRAAVYASPNEKSRRLTKLPPELSKHHNPNDCGLLGNNELTKEDPLIFTKLHLVFAKIDKINAAVARNEGPKQQIPLALRYLWKGKKRADEENH